MKCFMHILNLCLIESADVKKGKSEKNLEKMMNDRKLNGIKLRGKHQNVLEKPQIISCKILFLIEYIFNIIYICHYI